MKTVLFSSLFDLLGVLEKGSKRENLCLFEPPLKKLFFFEIYSEASYEQAHHKTSGTGKRLQYSKLQYRFRFRNHPLTVLCFRTPTPYNNKLADNV